MAMNQIENGPEAHWRQALSEGRLLLQRNRDSGKHIFPPRIGEPVDWVEASGLGVVYSVTKIQQRAPAEPYNVVLVDLEEGVRLMSRIEGIAPDAVTIGMVVKARIGQDADGPILLFDPVQAA